MSEWRDTIRAEITRFCKENNTQEFGLQDLLDFSESTLREKFPENNTWEASTRRTLQELRDDGEIEFLGNGRYRMNEPVNTNPTVWIEKTQTQNRPYKQKGEYKLGKALMSPSRDQGGRKRYETMREAEVGDIVIHLLQDQHQFASVSVIDSELNESFEGPPDDRWTDEQQEQGGYLRWLREYEGIEPQIHVYDDLLEKPEYQERLRQIREGSEKIFYDKRLSLNQGHYFTRCPDELVEILAEESPYLAELLEERGYRFDGGGSISPADPYEGITDATKDIKARVSQTSGAENWLGEKIAETIVRDWTEALRRSDLIGGIVDAPDAVKCEQIVQVYRDNTQRLEELAETIGSATIQKSSLDEGQVLFVALLRDLQSETGINPNMNHVKFGALLQGRHKGDGGDELTPPDRRPAETGTIERQLKQAQQLVFYGPPGTGKTYTARQFARWWLNQQSEYTPTMEQLETVTFHPSFSYEDFIEGLTAEADDGAVEYRIEDGVFKRICRRAETAYQHAKQNDDLDEARRFVLIVDEINRGNLAQIFGETITLLESDKRLDQPNEVEITLAHSRESFTVPPNLYVIGTMNTADRSIALVDAALRRRFRFLAFPPNYSVLIDHHGFEGLNEIQDVARTSSDPYRSLVTLSILAVRELNETIVDTPDLGKGKQIGHSYLMNLDEAADIVDAWKFEILPLLEEYYFGQFERIREELFQASGGRLFHWDTEEIADFTRDDLRRALASFVDISLVEPEVNGDTDEGADTVYTLNLLLEESVLQAGDELVFDEEKVPEGSDRPYDPSEAFWRCEITGKTGQSNGVRWLFNDEEYSFSGLAQAVLEQASEHSGKVTGPDYWRHPGFDNKRLVDIRSEVQSGALTSANREG
ncbi:AAA family ATPase [Haladaptatus salinisoli]|uniref:AAA family ATPase n=1 Tax=Haladaptatus salinisoli TaxID=2884876 RepID=UPI001D0B8CAC|nr:AAA family ATPase [Haladaptatus salinisoli]